MRENPTQFRNNPQSRSWSDWVQVWTDSPRRVLNSIFSSGSTSFLADRQRSEVRHALRPAWKRSAAGPDRGSRFCSVQFFVTFTTKTMCEKWRYRGLMFVNIHLCVYENVKVMTSILFLLFDIIYMKRFFHHFLINHSKDWGCVITSHETISQTSNPELKSNISGPCLNSYFASFWTFSIMSSSSFSLLVISALTWNTQVQVNILQTRTPGS